MADWMASGPALWIEVQVKDWKVLDEPNFDFSLCRTILEEYLRTRFESLQIGQSFKQIEVKTVKYHVQIEAINVLGFSGPHNATGIYSLSSTAIQIHKWHSHSSVADSNVAKDQSIRLEQIPNDTLSTSWRSLIFEDDLHFRLLRYMVRMIQLMRGPVESDHTLHNWNRLCLLHGPPGSGKTSLCRALAQQLGIAFGGRTLLQVDCNDLLSKYFGESAKHVNTVFSQVKAEAIKDHRLLVVLLDEVESIATSRARLSSGSENLDGLRVRD